MTVRITRPGEGEALPALVDGRPRVYSWTSRRWVVRWHMGGAGIGPNHERVIL